MSVSTAPGAVVPTTSRRERLRTEPAYQAFWLLRIGFTVAPILFGADKFADLLTNWDKYLAPWVNNIVPGTAHQAMYAVGVIEIVAGLAVLIVPRFGGYLVAAWLLGIIVNLLSIGNYYDVALRDFGLLLAALTLARLARAFPGESLIRRA
jgi:uncharacterized membrane protein YphA (DoxX/SURF4 family)